MIYLFGRLEYERIYAIFNSENNFQSLDDLIVMLVPSELKEEFKLPGFTATLNYSIILSEKMILQFSLLHQTSVMKTTRSSYMDDYGFLSDNLFYYQRGSGWDTQGVLYGYPPFLFMNFLSIPTFNDSKDVYNGLAVALLFRF